MPRKKNNFVLTADLKKQHDLLQKSCDAFDTGSNDQALSIATCLKVLLHDDKDVMALYFELGYQKYPFLSRVDQYLPENINSYSGLVDIQTATSKQEKYAPKIKSTSLEKTIMFEDWWHEVVIDDLNNLYSRKDMVLYVANNIDQNPNEIDHMPVLNTINWCTDEGEERVDNKEIFYPTVRAIAQEVLDSFEIYHKHIHNTTTQQKKYAFDWTIKVYNIEENRLFIITSNENPKDDYYETVFTNEKRLEGGYFASREYYEVFISRGNRVTGSYFLLNK